MVLYLAASNCLLQVPLTRSALAAKALAEASKVQASVEVDVTVGQGAKAHTVRQYQHIVAVEVASVNEPWMLGVAKSGVLHDYSCFTLTSALLQEFIRQAGEFLPKRTGWAVLSPQIKFYGFKN